MRVTSHLFLILPLALSSISTGQTGQLEPGAGSFVFRDPFGNKDKPITVWYYMPENVDADVPVVFVMHGVRRNGQEYRDSWVKYAETEKFLLLVPEYLER